MFCGTTVGRAVVRQVVQIVLLVFATTSSAPVLELELLMLVRGAVPGVVPGVPHSSSSISRSSLTSISSTVLGPGGVPEDDEQQRTKNLVETMAALSPENIFMPDEDAKELLNIGRQSIEPLFRRYLEYLRSAEGQFSHFETFFTGSLVMKIPSPGSDLDIGAAVGSPPEMNGQHIGEERERQWNRERLQRFGVVLMRGSVPVVRLRNGSWPVYSPFEEDLANAWRGWLQQEQQQLSSVGRAVDVDVDFKKLRARVPCIEIKLKITRTRTVDSADSSSPRAAAATSSTSTSAVRGATSSTTQGSSSRGTRSTSGGKNKDEDTKTVEICMHTSANSLQNTTQIGQFLRELAAESKNDFGAFMLVRTLAKKVNLYNPLSTNMRVLNYHWLTVAFRAWFMRLLLPSSASLHLHSKSKIPNS